MADILVTYFSKTGHTKAMAQYIAEAAGEVEGAHVTLLPVADVGADDLLDYDGIIMGSPVYYGTIAAPLKALIDESVKHHGELEGKVGGAFSSSGAIGGGTETTVLDIIATQLVHGMIVKGMPRGPHYGPMCQAEPDEQARRCCADYGRMVADLCVALFG